MIKYYKFDATDVLKPFINCFYYWEDENSNPPRFIESPPSAYNAIIFNLGQAYKVGFYGKERYTTPMVFFTGQATQSYTLELDSEISILGMVLKPTTLYHFLRCSQKPFVDKRCELSSFIEIDNLYQELKATTSTDEKINLLNQFWGDFVVKNKLKRSWFDESVDEIDQHFGNIKLNTILDTYEISQRQYEKLFATRVGVSPKSYMRMKRMSHICHLLSTNKEINWQDIVYEGGYYDQAHFIKDFIDFIGRNPSVYFKNNQELARLLRQ